jgi:hypothetical protein
MEYARLSHTIALDRPALHELLNCIPYMTLDQRKTVLTLCRVQTLPLPGTLSLRRLSKDLQSLVHNPIRGKEIHLLDIVTPCDSITSPILSGMISMLLRNAPIDEEELVMAVESGVRTEIAAAMDPHPPRFFNYQCFLSFDRTIRRTTSLHPGYPIDPALHDDIHFRFRTAMRKISSTTFYPDYSRKTIGRNGRRNMEEVLDRFGLRQEVEHTTLGLEQIYHRFGIRIAGETEARWAMKYNDLKPRVYYARGPDQYYDSNHVQAIFNILVDVFPCTNRFERFMLHSVRLGTSDTMVIYDYKSFTSKLREVLNFIDALSDFFVGTMARVIDSRDGPMMRDVGEILATFRQSCHDTFFDASGVLRDPSSEEELVHHNAGMLGVPGNISSCTLLHGLHLSIILGTLLCKVVGDDALGGGQVESMEELHSVLSEIGEIAKQKMECWKPLDVESEEDLQDRRWHYCKRPIDRVESRIHHGEMINWPPVAILLGWKDRIHTVQWPETEYGRHKRTASYLLSFTLQFESRILEPEDETLINRFLRHVAKKSGLEDYVESDHGRMLVYPRSVRSSRIVDDLIEDHWNCVIRIPEFAPRDLSVLKPEIAIWEVGRSSRMLKLARDLGHATVVSRYRDVLVRDAEDDVRKFFSKSKDLSPLYDVYLHDTLPSWMYDELLVEYYLSAHVSPDGDDPSMDDDIEVAEDIFL